MISTSSLLYGNYKYCINRDLFTIVKINLSSAAHFLTINHWWLKYHFEVELFVDHKDMSHKMQKTQPCANSTIQVAMVQTETKVCMNFTSRRQAPETGAAVGFVYVQVFTSNEAATSSLHFCPSQQHSQLSSLTRAHSTLFSLFPALQVSPSLAFGLQPLDDVISFL